MFQDAPVPVMSLCDLCLSRVCWSLDQLCDSRADGSLRLRRAPSLPTETADQLLHKMTVEGLLNDRTVAIFRDSKAFRLRRAFIRGGPVSPGAFRLALCPHRLQDLDASRLAEGHASGAEVLAALLTNPELTSSLQRLSLAGLQLGWDPLGPDGGPSVRAVGGFSSLRALRTLNLADTGLTDAALEEVCSLPLLESLDLSRGAVTSLAPLLGCRATLRSLSTHGLHGLRRRPVVMPTAPGVPSVLIRLSQLRHLDLSDDRFAANAVPCDSSEVDEVVQRLLEGAPDKEGAPDEEGLILPALVSLDVSGRKAVTERAVRAFVKARPSLVFLGLLATGGSACEVLTSRENLKVTGDANETQVCEALRRYKERECFLHEALVLLYNLTVDLSTPRQDLLQLVLAGMRSHPSSLQVQLVASACVFSLTTQDLAEAMPPRLLAAAVDQLLLSMQSFPSHAQVQKNCILALCSDYILLEISFNRYLATKLVMTWLSSHDDPTLQKMAVAIISVLVAELSTEETTQLGTDVSIIRQLLGVVQQRASLGVVDNTLRFALSALWNLTDGSPAAGRHFVQCQGLELYVEVLESYCSEPSVQQKVLGLLNNLAEVEELQGDLMEEDLLDYVLSVLGDPRVGVEVRYFAGGFLAQLSSRPKAWTLRQELLETIHQQLHLAVMTWSPAEREMVSYRCFTPFLPLLQTSQPAGVQLWAAWAVHLVCSHNAPHYSPMLQQEGVVLLLEALALHPGTHADVQALARLTLHLVGARQQAKRAPTGPPHKE
ncbi:protein zyg-11 homolog [Gadus macrocephalus]|uniref:protein zyg-11 homolog n=1 Tax=Gadus macrocephalus TaxID=80720 RepID=UPI0028CB6D25|nr:protein zyg-11 homolog [Gadus macrocephalus]